MTCCAPRGRPRSRSAASPATRCCTSCRTRPGHELDEEGAQLVNTLHATTGGNAFFLTETLRNLVETGALVQVDGTWSAAHAVDSLPLPRGVREVVRRRLSRLDDLAGSTLEVAATDRRGVRRPRPRCRGWP